MGEWFGSAGVCVNEHGELLMVLQGKSDEEKKWSIPSGGKEETETFEECCIRELKEETGYVTDIVEKIKVKRKSFIDLQISVEVHYFLVRIVGGEERIQDPDQLIYDIAWKNVDDLQRLQLSFPEDRQFLMNCIKENESKKRA